MKIHLQKACVRLEKGGPWLSAVAKMESPGVSSVTQIFLLNALGELAPHEGEIYDYRISFHDKILTEAGCATFEFG